MSRKASYDDEEYISRPGGRAAARKAMQKKRRKRKTIVISAISATVVIALIVGIITAVYAFIINPWDGRFSENFGGGGTGLPDEVYIGQTSSQDEIQAADDNLLTSKDGLKQIKDTSYVTNILLVGTDTRISGNNLAQSSGEMRTDSMMLLSINTKTKKIIMCSLLRDTYVKVDGYGGQKLNAAFFYGGTDLLKDTLKDNLYIDIDYYMAVDFFSFIEIVDAIGGLELTLSSDEIRVANNSYLIELNKLNKEPYGTDYIDYSAAGKPTLLNGKQVLAYTRNRYSHNYNDGTDNDFGRTSRQREVLTAITEKVKTKSILELSALYSKVLPYITTNIPSGMLTDLVLNNFFDYSEFEFVQTCLPQEGTYTNLTMDSLGSVLSINFKKNNNYLHDIIYEE